MNKTALGAKTFLYPMPVTLVGANVDGKPNYCVIAFCGAMNADPPILYVSLNRQHYTTEGIRHNGTFSVNIPSADMVAITDYCGIVSGGTVDKSTLFKTFYGKLETAPMIQECPVNLECRLIRTMEFEVDTAYIGEVAEVYSENKYMTGRRLDIKKINPMLFATHERSYWSIGGYIGKAWNIGQNYTKIDDIRR